MAINYKQRIFNEWIFCIVLLLISFITFISTFFYFSNCDSCFVHKIIVQFLLFGSIFLLLFYLLGFVKQIETQHSIDYLIRFSFLKHINVSILLLVFILMIKIFYSSEKCFNKKEPFICKVELTSKDSLNLYPKKDTIIIREIVNTKLVPIHIKPLVKCNHQYNCECDKTFNALSITQPIIDSQNKNSKVLLDAISKINNDTIILSLKEYNIYNYSINKMKVKTKKSIFSYTDSLSNNIVIFGVENQKIKNKKIINN